MKPLARAIGLGLGCFFLGSWLAATAFGKGLFDQTPLVIGYAAGVLGWLLGIGVWNSWLRELLGMDAKPDDLKGWRRYFGFCTDHKVIGIQYIVTFVVVMLLAGLLAMAMRIELQSPGRGIMAPGTFNQVMSLHGILMIAVAVAVMLGGFGNYLVPLMIGADDMAFPRLNALSYWLVPPLAVAILGSPLVGGFDSGWTAYPPLSVVNARGQVLFVAGVITFGLSSILGGINFLATVATKRAKGMTWTRLPIFVWSVVAASILSVTVTQFFAASLLMVLLDRTASMAFFEATRGGDPLLYQHIFWFYSHPAVYIMILPAFGMALEVASHMARKPVYAYKLVVGGLLAIVGLSVIVWAHHMFTSGMASSLRGPFMVTTELISIPTGIVFLSALGTLWRGRIRLDTPMLFFLAFVLNFLIGGITGIFLADVATDVQLQDTYFVVAHFHYTIMGGEIFAMMAGIYFWFPKITGRMYNETAGRIHAVWMWAAFNVTFLGMFWAGIHGMNRRIADYQPGLAYTNRFVSIASYFLGASFVVFVVNLVVSAIRGRRASDNPWQARTLEWETTSPPPEHNFDKTIEVVAWPYDYGLEGAHHAILADGNGDKTKSVEDLAVSSGRQEK
jgi:cytochrome c oxidase subunit 1